MQFPDRYTAGCELAAQLQDLAKVENVIVLGLPRGGLPVAMPVASALSVPLDVLVVKKLGVPGQPELAFGAVASGGVKVFNDEVIMMMHLSAETIAEIVRNKQQEVVQRTNDYRENTPYPDLADKHVVLVDDGIATGATMEAAIQAVKSEQPRQITVAIPVAPADTYAHLSRLVDRIVCLCAPRFFSNVGAYFADFEQVKDSEVRRILRHAK